MPKFFMLGIALFLLLAAAGYGITTLQARSIPWDCTDWQAFAHADRTTSILESLAENRGKTLYCGIDQSDTFAKAETWEAGKDRNERDDTVYFGERGQFRGFLASQEGWLTEGESGVTGVSIDRIFEFPREERRRTKRVKRLHIANDAEQFPINAVASCDEVLGLVCGDWWPSYISSTFSGNITASYREARYQWGAQHGVEEDWRTFPSSIDWQELAEAKAARACQSMGYRLQSATFGQGHSENNADGVNSQGDYLGWFYENQPAAAGNGLNKHRARLSRTWTATCKKVIRRTRK